MDTRAEQDEEGKSILVASKSFSIFVLGQFLFLGLSECQWDGKIFFICIIAHSHLFISFLFRFLFFLLRRLVARNKLSPFLSLSLCPHFSAQPVPGDEKFFVVFFFCGLINSVLLCKFGL
jgi:hypothetical protein